MAERKGASKQAMCAHLAHEQSDHGVEVLANNFAIGCELRLVLELLEHNLLRPDLLRGPLD